MMFNRSKIAKLEADILSREAQITAMAKTIRDQDQLIFQMSQMPDWPTMRPIFAKLCEVVNARMRNESDRIRDLMIPEIKKTYTEPKRLT